MKKKLLALKSMFLTSSMIISIALTRGENTTKNEQVILTDNTAITTKDSRVEVLDKFFETYNSPLQGHAQTFVNTAEKYGIDYKLLPAISCVESTCGKFIIPESYNPFGWGIHGSQYIAFNDFDEAIEKVGEGLDKIYFSKGLDTIPEIAPVYTPPNSNHWMGSVNYFIYEMEEIEKNQEQEALKQIVLSYL